jgi:TM2 domain-containing membrane protein YozV
MSIKRRNSGLAFFLSFIFPGLGQLYNGRKGKAAAFIFLGVLFIVAIALGFVIQVTSYDYFGYSTTETPYIVLSLLCFFLYFLLWLVGWADALRDAQKINKIASENEKSNTAQGYSNEPRYQEQYPGQ